MRYAIIQTGGKPRKALAFRSCEELSVSEATKQSPTLRLVEFFGDK